MAANKPAYAMPPNPSDDDLDNDNPDRDQLPEPEQEDRARAYARAEAERLLKCKHIALAREHVRATLARWRLEAETTNIPF